MHTKLRHRCSGLSSDLYRVNLKDDQHCVCGHIFEDAFHFFLECPLYQHDKTLCDCFNNIVPISIEYILSDVTKLVKNEYFIIQISA